MDTNQTHEPAEGKAKPLTSTQRVYDAVCELRGLDQIATRETVAELTDLKLQIVDDRLRALVDDGRLKRLLRGVYELVEIFPPPRAMWCGILPDGYVKFELGEHVITMTPREARNSHRALGGFAEDARVIESTRAHLFLATELAAKVEKQEREIKAMRAVLRGAKIDVQQLELLGE
jgi:hypothetical protein